MNEWMFICLLFCLLSVSRTCVCGPKCGLFFEWLTVVIKSQR
jgi:hypothetical protein